MHGGGSDIPGANSFVTGLIDFTAGSLGGAALVYVSQPLDTVKVKMQAFPQLYRGMVNCLIQTYKKDGVVRGLYAGTIPAVIANVSENSVLFAAYGGCQKVIATLRKKESTKDLSVLDNATSGFLAAFFSSFSLCPTELIKCKLQAMRETTNPEPGQKVAKVTSYQLTRRILKTEGIPGMYRGLTSTMMREMPGYFFFFGGYEACREFLRKPEQSKDEIGLLKTMVAGATGGLVLWTVIFPADVIKSRIQVQSLRTSMTRVGIDIYKSEGIRGFYCGLTPTLLRTAPATAVLFVVYEYSKKFMTQLLS